MERRGRDLNPQVRRATAWFLAWYSSRGLLVFELLMILITGMAILVVKTASETHMREDDVSGAKYSELAYYKQVTKSLRMVRAITGAYQDTLIFGCS